MHTRLPYRPDIDGLRALAILPVVLFHLGVPGFSGGFVGVDIFFVISGYLITLIIRSEMIAGKFSFLSFFEKRVRRIVPALAVVLAATTLVSIKLLLPYDLIAFDRSLISAATGLANLRFLEGAGYFAGASHIKPLLHTWSLSLEEQYYLFFPLILWMLIRFARRGVLPALTLMLLASFAAATWMAEAWPKGGFYLLPFRAWEFLAGALLAVNALPGIHGQWHRDLMGFSGLSITIYAITMPDTTGLAAILPVIGAGLILHAGNSGVHMVGRALSRPLPVFIGLISYSLYLWHWPLIVFTRYVTLQPPDAWQQLAIVTLSLFLAWVSWRWIERPFRGKSAILSRPLLLRAAAVALTGFAVTAITLELSHGLPQRVTQKAIQLQSYASNPPLTWQGALIKLFPASRDYIRPEKAEHKASNRPPFPHGFGEPKAAPEFVLWGDSHAANLVSAISAFMPDHAGRSLALSGCAPLMGSGDRQCLDFNRGVVQWIEANPSIRTVFLAANWGFYSQGDRYRESARDPIALIPGHRLAENPQLFRQGVQNTARFFRQRGIDIVWMLDNPNPGWDVPMVMARAGLWGGKLPAMPTLKEHEKRQQPLLDALNALDGAYLFFDPTPTLCPSGFCPAEEAGIPLYRDDNHLSPPGIKKVTPLLEQTMRNRLEKKKPAAA